MGNPIRPRKKYKTPAHPWQGSRIEQEKIIKKEYGLKNKTEIWRFQSLLRKYTSHAKKLIGTKTAQSEKEKEQLLNRLFKLKIIEKDTKIEDVLDLNVNDFLDRRLQTIIFKANFGRTPKQARQLITHGHIQIKDQKVTVPSYLVSRDEEQLISYNPNSSIAKDDHPERAPKKEKKKNDESKEKETKEKPKKEKKQPMKKEEKPKGK